MKKLLFTVLFLVFIAPIFNASAFKSQMPTLITSFYEDTDQWEFIEYFFIQKPKAKQNSFSKTLPKWLLTAMAGGSGGYLSKYVLDNFIDDREYEGEVTKTKKQMIATLIGLTSAYATHKAVSNTQQYNREIANLLIFLKHWPDYSSNTPSALRSMFNKLYVEYNQYPERIKENSIEIIALIKDKVYAHFPQKYFAIQNSIEKPFSLTSFFDSKNFNARANFDFGIGKTLDGIAKIIRELKR